MRMEPASSGFKNEQSSAIRQHSRRRQALSSQQSRTENRSYSAKAVDGFPSLRLLWHLRMPFVK